MEDEKSSEGAAVSFIFHMRCFVSYSPLGEGGLLLGVNVSWNALFDWCHYDCSPL